MAKIHWSGHLEEDDMVRARHYLAMRLDEATAGRYLVRLRVTPVFPRPILDILRAADLPIIPETDPEVDKIVRRMKRNLLMPGVLMVSLRGGGCEIAAGYERLCAGYHVNSKQDVPVRLACLLG